MAQRELLFFLSHPSHHTPVLFLFFIAYTGRRCSKICRPEDGLIARIMIKVEKPIMYSVIEKGERRNKNLKWLRDTFFFFLFTLLPPPLLCLSSSFQMSNQSFFHSHSLNIHSKKKKENMDNYNNHKTNDGVNYHPCPPPFPFPPPPFRGHHPPCPYPQSLCPCPQPPPPPPPL